MSSASQDYRLNDELLGPVLATLNAYQDPYLKQGLVDAGCVTKLAMNGTQLQLGLVYPYPCETQYRDTVMTLTQALAKIDGIDEVEAEMDFKVKSYSATGNIPPIPNVKQVIAVASGKGGVGKSTTSVNLALALAAEGANVGILDADIYGPSVPMMLGVTDFRPLSPDGKYMTCANAHGISAQSIGFLLTDDQAAVWRGPMAAGALLQLVNESLWQDLDYLVIDLPPGTGDIQLTLSQKVPVSGAVIVTTPQDIALADAQKGISMFEKVNIPVLGVVENMSFYLCPECGHKEYPFGSDGGARIAQRYNVPLLGALPLNGNIRENMDQGIPTVVADADGDVAAIYRDIARKVAASLALQQQQSTVSIAISEEE